MYTKKLEAMVEERTRQLIHADRLATLGTFSAGIAHEINNSNTYISGNVQILIGYWKIVKPIIDIHLDEDSSGKLKKMSRNIPELMEGIFNGSKIITNILEGLRCYAKQDIESEIENCRLLDPVEDAIALLTHFLKKGVIIETLIEPSLNLDCDRQQISQVFVNLFKNAIDAFETQSGKIKVYGAKENNNILIKVSDNGPGFTKEIENKLFDAFFTTKAKTRGTGLGLSIVTDIIAKHNGKISVSSQPNNGTVFEIILPDKQA